eukprot:SAG31_NODE_1995_length_6708_cov_49.258889_7_plen_269_part_00
MAESRLRRLLSHVTPAGTGLAAAAAVARPVSGSATVRKVGIIMNGVTGRMGTNQHLLRSLVPIIREGGLRLDGTAELLVPQLLLVGRNEAKLRTLVERAGVECIEFTTDLSAALSDSRYELYFDAQTTGRRAYGVRAAVAAGKHIYCEKPVASTSAEARELADLCEKAGVKNGVVQDKLFLPGVIKLQRAIEKGFFGKILSVRGEFGYWVFVSARTVSMYTLASDWVTAACRKATGCRRTDRAGTTGSVRAVELLWTCWLTGAMYWII